LIKGEFLSLIYNKKIVLPDNHHLTFDSSAWTRIKHNMINTDPLTVRIHQPVEYKAINLLQYNNTIPKKNENNPYT
jgi:hypothetical protein